MKVQSGFKAVFSPELNCDVVTPDHNSTPILCSYLSSSSKKEDNLYNTPGHTEPTYQSIFTPEMGLVLVTDKESIRVINIYILYQKWGKLKIHIKLINLYTGDRVSILF